MALENGEEKERNNVKIQLDDFKYCSGFNKMPLVLKAWGLAIHHLMDFVKKCIYNIFTIHSIFKNHFFSILKIKLCFGKSLILLKYSYLLSWTNKLV